MTILILTAFLFYIAIPGVGAVAVRRRWRRFRRAVVRARDLQVDFGSPARGSWISALGTLSGIEGGGQIWIRIDSQDIRARISEGGLYVMPPYQAEHATEPMAAPEAIHWRDLSGIAEGTPVLVSGPQTSEVDAREVRITPFEPSLLLLFDGDRNSIFERAIRFGRQRNEYWNQITPVALITGMIALSFLSLQTGAITGLVLSALPVLPLFPPGVLGFYWYRRLWRQGRRIRAERDVRLVARRAEPDEGAFFSEQSRRAAKREGAALILFIVGMVTNVVLCAFVLAWLL